MKSRIASLIGGGALAGALLAGCGGNHGGTTPVTNMPAAPPKPPATMKELDTAAVLAIVQTMTSETAAPFEVDNGAIAVTPVGDETSSPVGVIM